MGYSCSAKAHDRLGRIMNLANGKTGRAILSPQWGNSWSTDNGSYFYEYGPEEADGAIVGEVYKELPEGKCVRSGSFKINPNGTVDHFYCMPMQVLSESTQAKVATLIEQIRDR